MDNEQCDHEYNDDAVCVRCGFDGAEAYEDRRRARIQAQIEADDCADEKP